GTRLAEVAADPLAGVAPLLVTDDGDAAAAEVGEAADDRLVVAVGAIAVHLDPIAHQVADVVQGVGALGMPRHLHLLPGAEVGVDLGGGPLERRAQAFELLVLAAARGKALELLDAPAELDQGLFERFRGLHKPAATLT